MEVLVAYKLHSIHRLRCLCCPKIVFHRTNMTVPKIFASQPQPKQTFVKYYSEIYLSMPPFLLLSDAISLEQK